MSAHNNDTRRAQNIRTPVDGDTSFTSSFSWDDFRYLELVARSGSYRATEKANGIPANTLRRRIAILEKQVGLTLLIRTSKGVQVTQEGQDFIDAAQEMMVPLRNLRKKFGPKTAPYKGKVRVAITEGIGSFWVAPRAADFRRRFHDINLNLNFSMRPAEESLGKADLMVQLSRPHNPDLIATRLGFMHAMFFASETYIRENGEPKSAEDLSSHRFVEQDAEQIPKHLIHHVMNEEELDAARCITTNSSHSHFYSVVRGVGIGVLPTYVTVLTDGLQPLDIDFVVKREIWLAYTKEAGSLLRVRRTIEWLKNSFSSQLFPWFSDDFVHPHAFHLEPERESQLRFLRDLNTTVRIA